MHWSCALAASTPVGLMLQRWRSKFPARYGFVEADTSERAARHSPKREPRPKLGNSHGECIEGYELKSQHAIEADRARHVMGGERDGADVFDHRPSSNARGARSLGQSLGLGGNRAVGMTQIAALVAPPHVVDQRIRPLALHLEGGDQRVFRRHRHALVFASDVYADGKFEHHGALSPATSVGGDARLGLLELR